MHLNAKKSFLIAKFICNSKRFLRFVAHDYNYISQNYYNPYSYISTKKKIVK